MTKRSKFTDIDGYIASAPLEVRPILEEIRRTAKAKAPDAIETISYQMPALKQRKVFFYFAAFKNHIGVYPPVKGDKNLQKALLPYRGEKGNLKFPLDQPMPYDLIGRVVLALSLECAE
jgi:uncharacterized protein YdhG (YjbR/CyaY superfamily)